MTALLAHYSLAKETPKTGKLVKFKDLPGGYAFEHAFTQRAVNPIAQAFSIDPTKLVEAAKMFGGKRMEYGDVSVEISALEGIPLYSFCGLHMSSQQRQMCFLTRQQAVFSILKA